MLHLDPTQEDTAAEIAALASIAATVTPCHIRFSRRAARRSSWYRRSASAAVRSARRRVLICSRAIRPVSVIDAVHWFRSDLKNIFTRPASRSSQAKESNSGAQRARSGGSSARETRKEICFSCMGAEFSTHNRRLNQ